MNLLRFSGRKGLPTVRANILYNKGFEDGETFGAVAAKEEVLGFLRRTGASPETLKAWLEKGEQ